MFQFPACPPVRLWIHLTVIPSSGTGFPHSDIHGSKPACGSPWLFAACHVLLRRMVPGHPPCALSSLIFSSLCDPETNCFLYLRLAPPSGFASRLQLAFSESFLLCSCQGAFPGRIRFRGPPPFRASPLKTIQSSSRNFRLTAFFLFQERFRVPFSRSSRVLRHPVSLPPIDLESAPVFPRSRLSLERR